MLVFPLALLLTATPPALETWATRACPPSKAEPDSNVEMKLMGQRRAECLRKAMNKALDRAILPLKKSRPDAFKEWMALQDDYNRWMAEACAAAEEANWVDLTTGERSMGTGYGFTESQCLQRHHAWRGYYADAWARGERNPLAPLSPALEGPAAEARSAWNAYRDRVLQTVARAPTRAVDPARPSRKLSRDDWKPYVERLERVLAGPELLATHQCALVPARPTDCVQRFADSLFAQMDPPQPPGPSEGGP
ncbi:hypothetical protein CYFUS_009719 [Cystobacter fuscus]|uniref:Uncharacterized protein n=1 Tax=Cystobacter fuscus TaxID=43 RepID=A0A250JL89_9BACT|nr:hypothetical protein [Cystobacter fuscus]ATB44232.1 hypothetical protein CYFUS_009719 [Cystobacter fuscus]